MADRLGRKKLMLADMIIIATGAATSALANGSSNAVYRPTSRWRGSRHRFPRSSSYVSEVLPKHSRARMMVATIACQSVGMVLPPWLHCSYSKNVHSVQTWRFFLVTEGVIALLFFLLRLSEPESPHWLMTRGRVTEAAHAFLRIMPEQREEVLQITRRCWKSRCRKCGRASETPGIAILFSRAYRARTVLVAVPWFLMDIATYGVGLFTPIILGAIDVSTKGVGVIGRDFADAKGSAAIDLFLLFGFLVGIWAVPRYGRIRMQVIGFAGMALGMLLLTIAVPYRILRLAGDSSAACSPDSSCSTC